MFYNSVGHDNDLIYFTFTRLRIYRSPVSSSRLGYLLIYISNVKNGLVTIYAYTGIYYVYNACVYINRVCFFSIAKIIV